LFAVAAITNATTASIGNTLAILPIVAISHYYSS